MKTRKEIPTEPIFDDVARLLRSAQGENSISSEQAAREMGIASSTLNRWMENPGHFRLSSLARLCRIYGKSLEAMIEVLARQHPPERGWL